MKDSRTVTDVQVNACNGETVHLTGELREDTKVHDSKVDQHIKANLTGIGNLGNDYKFELDVQSKWDTASMTMSLKDHQVLVSKARPRPARERDHQRITAVVEGGSGVSRRPKP